MSKPPPRAFNGNGVACPECDGVWSHVLDSRPAPGYWRRRRQCDACGVKFTTNERVVVAKVGGMVGEFKPGPLRKALERALRQLERNPAA